jgi:hypothetical protein
VHATLDANYLHRHSGHLFPRGGSVRRAGRGGTYPSGVSATWT